MAYVAGVFSADCCATTTATQLDGIAFALLELRPLIATMPHRSLGAGSIPAHLPSHHSPVRQFSHSPESDRAAALHFGPALVDLRVRVFGHLYDNNLPPITNGV